jgi:hypothetical protein
MTMKEEQLEAQNKELSDRIAKLEAKVNPPKPVEWTWQKPDPTENMRMHPNTLADMVACVPDSLVRSLVADFVHKPNPVTGYSAPQPSSQGPRGSGWRDEVPITSPPGVALADQLMDAQDRRDLVENAQKLAAAEIALKAAKGDSK